jgi:hypothetical protein
MPINHDHRARRFSTEDIKVYSAGTFIVLLVLIAVFYAYQVVPETNQSVVNLIVGALLTMGVLASKRIFGDANEIEEQAQKHIAEADERVAAAELRAARQLEKMTASMEIFEAKYDTLKQAYDQMITLLVDRHVVLGKGVDLVPGNRSKDST